MKNAAPIALLALIVLFPSCASRTGIKHMKKATPAEIQALADQLEPLFTGGHEMRDTIPAFKNSFATLGCKDEWVSERDLANERRERARKIAAEHPAAAVGLETSQDPKALFVAAMLRKYRDGDYQSYDRSDVNDLLKRAADGGNAHAKYEQAAALMKQYPFYSNQPGDPKKFVEINALLVKAAEGGSARAAHALSMRTGGEWIQKKFPGEIIPGNDRPLRYWSKLAAERGNDEAQQSLSYGRRDIGLSDEEANKWLEASARAGNDHANYYLGGNYENGVNGYPTDLDKAIYYHCRSIYFGGQWSTQAVQKIQEFKSTQTEPAPTFTPEQAVFDTGLGEGKYDRMTYADYTGTLELTPVADITSRSLRPRLWYCNGLCFFETTVRDELGETLATGRWQGSVINYPYLVFAKPLTLKSGKTYSIVLRGWTTKSIGVMTVGADRTNKFGQQRSLGARHGERGAIAFELWDGSSPGILGGK